MSELNLFPRPRILSHLDATRRYDHTVVEVSDDSLPNQGFALLVDESAATLRYADEPGRRYGRSCVAQLRDDSGSLPSVELHDHPDYRVRGFMLDISRDRVPTRQTLDRLVAVLETCRFNHLQLYVEHTYAYRDHIDVWRDASPMDADDLIWLRDRCGESGIELGANQNCFGHFARWLSHDRYRHMAECPDGFDIVPGVHFPPTVLEPTTDNAEFAVGIAREQIAAFGARTVNVGCDETFELGRGASRQRVDEIGSSAVYAQHLRRIIEPLIGDGMAVQFWGDVIAHHPQSLDLIPTDGTTALVWNYDAPDAPRIELPDSLRVPLMEIGIDLSSDTHFASRLEPFVDARLDHWVCPGTSTWNTLIGRLDNALSNIVDAVRAGLDSGASGMLLTDWGDGGHHQPLTVSYPPIAYAGAVSWCVDTNADLDPSEAINRYICEDSTGILGGVLDRIGRVAARTGVIAANASPLLPGVVHGGFVFRNGLPDPVSVRDVIDTLDSALEDLGRSRPECDQADEMLEELSVAIGLARIGAQSLGAEAGIETPSPSERASQLEDLIARYRAAWLTTSRPGGLDDSTAHLDATVDELRKDQT